MARWEATGTAFRALAILAGIFLALATYAGEPVPACVPLAATQPARVVTVIDGDTLRLTDGRRVRLIGINAPELHDRDGEIEPGAVEARHFASRFLGNSQIRLTVGRVARDRYGRTLAHVWRADGVSLEAALLTAGLARFVAIPPDLEQLDCLRASERQARTRRAGLWASGEFLPRAVTALQAGENGFRLLRGRVSAVERSRSAWWVEIDGRVALRIAPADQRNFTFATLRDMRGREVEFRGWLVWRKAGTRSSGPHPPWQMGLRHPAALSAYD